jgi:hypothetical protein
VSEARGCRDNGSRLKAKGRARNRKGDKGRRNHDGCEQRNVPAADEGHGPADRDQTSEGGPDQDAAIRATAAAGQVKKKTDHREDKENGEEESDLGAEGHEVEKLRTRARLAVIRSRHAARR